MRRGVIAKIDAIGEQRDGTNGERHGKFDHDEIVEAACQAWRNPIVLPDVITSIGMRKWAHAVKSYDLWYWCQRLRRRKLRAQFENSAYLADVRRTSQKRRIPRHLKRLPQNRIREAYEKAV